LPRFGRFGMGNSAAFIDWIAGLGQADILGVFGVVAYVGSYFALQVGLIRGDGYLFPALNLLAALAILASLWESFNLYSVTVEIAWVVISIIGLARLYIVKHLVNLTPEQADVARRLVPGLKKDQARQLLRLGRFKDAAPGQVIATEGRPVADLAVVIAGRCRIEREGVAVASVGPGALIGEMTFATGGPATATVRVDISSRLFLIERGALIGFLQKNPAAMADMEISIASDLRSKLADTTARLSGHLVRARDGAGPADPDGNRR
jgi:CRP-like cAMP-binding protein